MFSPRSIVQPASAAAASVQATRNMATLKEISMRLKSIQNIAKITKSVKMIASTKVPRAQRLMEQSRVFGRCNTAFQKHAEVPTTQGETSIVVTVSSDRGLCGGIHSYVSKATKRFLAANPNAHAAICGLKAKMQVQREYRNNIFISFDAVTKNQPTWFESAIIGDAIYSAKPEFDSANIIYNKFKSVIAYDTTTAFLPGAKAVAAAPKIAAYEFEDDLLKNFEEFNFANTLYCAFAEGYASEMCAKRTAMENATKNAGDMIQRLTLTYNRSRQAKITNELIDIITGASAL